MSKLIQIEDTDVVNFDTIVDLYHPLEPQKAHMAITIANFIVKYIEPEYIELEGAELMRYSVLIKKWEEDDDEYKAPKQAWQ